LVVLARSNAIKPFRFQLLTIFASMTKTAVITGATKGIGRAIAETFADLEAMKQTFAEAYPTIKVHIRPTDMSIKAQVMEFGEWIKTIFTEVDVLVNNAGIYIGGAVVEEEDGALEAMINTNLYSAYYLSRNLVSGMISAKKGHIFNICSIASIIAYPNGGSYSISKFAMLGFSKVLREELKETGVKVTSILPGATWSNSWQGVDLPTARLMQANDVAEALY